MIFNPAPQARVVTWSVLAASYWLDAEINNQLMIIFLDIMRASKRTSQLQKRRTPPNTAKNQPKHVPP